MVKAKSDRTVIALKSFVKGKLRDSTPEMYKRKFQYKGIKPTMRQELFLRYDLSFTHPFSYKYNLLKIVTVL